MLVTPIAHIENDFPEKFGLPRQSGLSRHLISKVVMEKPYRVPEAFRGLEGYSHLWLLWEFDPVSSDSAPESFSPTVRPPKLGGNERRGVFATRSPNRPNRIGLTLVRLIRIEEDEGLGTMLIVAGADMKSGTKILDIKPYVEYADYPGGEIRSGFAEKLAERRLTVEFVCEMPAGLTEEDVETLTEVLSLDPRPGYQHDSGRVYGMAYRDYQVKFTSDGEAIRVIAIEHEKK